MFLSKKGRMWPSHYIKRTPISKMTKQYCAYCGIELVEEHHPHIRTRDHILPRQFGRIPPQVARNLRPACGACNMLRGTLGHCVGLLMLCVIEARYRQKEMLDVAVELSLRRSREERKRIKREKARRFYLSDEEQE